MVFKFVRSRRGFLLSMAGVALGIKACQSRPSVPEATPPSTPVSPSGSPLSLYGAGSTFASFLYLKWFNEYNAQHPTVQISYQPVGSAAGIQQFLANTVDFAASEVPLTADEEAQINRGIVLIPTTSGSIGVVYNLPGIGSGLKLSREVLADIFLGTITQWNDPKLVALNPDLTLPDQPMLVLHRSDGSGTTAAFTAHLSAISPTWKETVGTGLNVQWVTGTGIKDNAGISAQIQQAAGTIGYVEYAFAKQLELSLAALENKAGQFVEPNQETATKALATIELSEDLQGSVADPDGSDAYPIVTYTWLLAYQSYEDPQKAQVLRQVLQWGLTEGQAFGPDLGYVPLTEEVIQKSLTALEQIGA